MNKVCHFSLIVTPVAFVALLLAGTPGFAQTPSSVSAADRVKAARAKRQAEVFEAQARVLTVFDRAGQAVKTVGGRALYHQPVLSPDRTRVAVVIRNLEKESADVWVFNVATGNRSQITFSANLEMAWAPAWSPDGSQLAYIALRDSYERVYRKASNGAGSEELLYQHPGANLASTDWSKDGRFLTFSSTDLSGGTVYALPLVGDGQRKPIEVFRSESQVRGGRLSPDSRFLSYSTDESGRFEVYVRPFDPSAAAAPAARPWQLSDQGVFGLPGSNRVSPDSGPFWRQDGKEMYFVAPDQRVMAVEVSTTSTFEFGKPRSLYRMPDQGSSGVGQARVSDDGEQSVLVLHPAPTRPQITVFDRQGKIVTRLGDAFGRNPSLSPDGTRVAFVRGGQSQDIWTFDVASGKGTPVTNDAARDNDPIWSPDGSQVAYVSTRGSFSSIYRKAWDGTGKEEQLFRYTPGAGIVLTDWSADGKFLTFHDGCSGVLHVVPLIEVQNALERKAIDWLRDEYGVAQARFSPDARFMAYLSDEIEPERFEVYVRSFDASQPEAGAGSAKPVQVTTSGALGMIFWRQDGKELYFLTTDWEVMAVDVTTTPSFKMGTPKLLFKLPGPLVGNPQQWRNVSRDGQRFVFSINVPVNPTAR